MHDSETCLLHRSRFQLTIGRALFLLVLISLGLGWWSDHSRLTKRLESSEIQREIQDRQIAHMRSAHPRARVPIVVNSRAQLKSPEQFIELVRSMRSATSVPVCGAILRTAEGHYAETVERLLELMRDPEEHVRRNACLVLKEQCKPPFRDRMESYASVMTKRAVEVLKSGQPGGEDTHCAIELLAAIGPAAKEATHVLQSIADDDRDVQAVYATIAIGKVRPEMDVEPRLIELIDAKNIGWEDAAIALMEHRSTRDVRDFLVQRYHASSTKADQDVIVDLLNRLGL